MANSQRNQNIRKKKFRLRMSGPFDPSAIIYLGMRNQKYFKIYFTRFFYFDYYTRLLYAIFICHNKWNTLGAHCLLFLLFSLKNEDNRHLMGVDKRWIWVVQVIE
jgi:hypothetical protein